ncbi:exodeoxyribonuclease VII small subunit [Desulfosarcina widdelii]
MIDTMAKKAPPSFEKAVDELEKIVKSLESGDLPLEKALEKFEAGIKLSRYCSEKLDDAEKRVTLLMADENGETIEKSFDVESE